MTTLLVLVSLACIIQIPGPPTETTVVNPVVNTVVNTPDPTPTPTQEPDNTATVVKPVVNVRAKADRTSASVGYVEAGDLVVIVRCSGNWCRIQDPPGYIWRGCLTNNPNNLKCEAAP